jgi:uncharacterized protein (DUF305 family)
MKTRIKLSVVLLAGIFLFAGCNNNKMTTETEKTDTTGMMKPDSTEKMNDDNKMDNSLMGAMNSMMNKMEAMTITGDFDLDFANMMIEHHQGAVDMSNIELSKGSDEKMKSMAQNIITKQTEDIAKLREFVQSYKPSGMKHGEGELKKMLADMKSAMQGMQMTGNTDKDFASMMISHHEKGMKMSKAELSNGMSQELKNMAKKGISHETKEIEEFKVWLAANK